MQIIVRNILIALGFSLLSTGSTYANCPNGKNCVEITPNCRYEANCINNPNSQYGNKHSDTA